MRRYLLTWALASLVAAPLRAQVTVTTGTPGQSVGPIGKDTELGAIPTTFAQTFRAPAGFSSLQSFSLYLTNFFGGGALLLNASVYQWQTDHLTGNALYTTQLTGTNSSLNVLTQFGSAVSPLNLLLTQGTTYAFVMSAANRYALTPDGSSVLAGGTLTDAYANGGLFLSNATTLNALSATGAFFAADGVPDAAFSATFVGTGAQVVPEPGAGVLVAGGLVVLFWHSATVGRQGAGRGLMEHRQ